MEYTLITSRSFAHPKTAHWISAVLLATAFATVAMAQTAPSINWYTLAGSDFNPLTGQTQTLGIQVFLHSTDPRVVAFRATSSVQLGTGLGSPAIQGTATNVLDDRDTMVYIPVTPNSANASLQTLWVLVELFLADGSTYSSLQRLPAPWQSYPITITSSNPVSRGGATQVR